MQNSHNSKDVAKHEEVDRRKAKTTLSKQLSKPSLAYVGRTRTKLSLKDPPHSNDAQLIRTGLRRLASNVNPPVRTPANTSSKMTANEPVRKTEVLRTFSPRNLTGRILKDIESADSEEELPRPVKIKERNRDKVYEDKQTMTEIPLTGTPLGLMERTLLNDEPYVSGDGRDLQWTDPRLLRKYALPTKQRYKKSLTIPLVRSEQGQNEILSEISLDDLMEDTENPSTEIVCNKSETLFLKSMYYMCTASVSFIGSLCGVILITMVLWKLFDDNVFSFGFMSSDRTFPVRIFPAEVRKISSSVFQAWSRILRRALTVSARDVLVQENEGWFGMFQ